MNNFETIYRQIVLQSEKLVREDKLDVNSREYELAISKIVTTVIQGVNRLSFCAYLQEQLDSRLKEDKGETTFGIFYCLFTMYRHESFDGITDIFNKYSIHFDKNKFQIIAYLSILARYSEWKERDCMQIVRDAEQLCLQASDSTTSLNKNLIAVTNLYVESACKYYEENVIELKNEEVIERLKKCEQLIYNLVLTEAHDKFYLNLGRVNILLGKYEDGIRNIDIAINNIKQNPNRSRRVMEYQNYKLRATMFQTIDQLKTDFNKIEKNLKDEVKKNELDSKKIIGIVSVLFGYFSVNVAIIKDVSSPEMMIVGMLCLFGLTMIITGILMMYFNFETHEKQADIILPILKILLGGICFISTILFVQYENSIIILVGAILFAILSIVCLAIRIFRNKKAK